jgi:hypothetical protein
VTTTTTIIPAVDRYDRLRNAVEIVASDPAVENVEQPRNSEGLRAYVYSLAEERILDGLSGHDADTVSMLVALDFLKGPPEWRSGSRSGWTAGVAAPSAPTTTPGGLLRHGGSTVGVSLGFRRPGFPET